MKIAECNHIRIRDGNTYGMNVERTIKQLEDLYQIDFRTLPQWQKLVQRMHLAITDCKRKIQDSKRRKATIIDKLCIQSCRPSPFELTDELARTAKRWKAIEANLKIKKESILNLTESVHSSVHDETVYGEILGEESLGHPNTDASPDPTGGKDELLAMPESHLPTYVCINQHKRISLLQSDQSSLSVADSGPAVMPVNCVKKPDDWLVLPQSTNIFSVPDTITIENQSLNEQTISFSLITFSSEYPYLNLRYKGLTDNTPFRRAKILPVTPVKLFPGLAVNFKFVFKLQPNPEDFTVNLFFKVGQKVLAEAPVEGFSLPVVGVFSRKPEAIHVTEEINIPTTYFWHINANCGFPFSDVTIKVPDKHCYNLHITKRNLNLVQESEHDIFSIEPMTLSSTTIAQRDLDQEVIAQSKTFVSSNESQEETESALISNFITLIINDAIERALDVFVFEKTYLPLQPFSKQTIKVYQTKVEHIGFHQSLYEFKFTNPETEETVLHKTVKVLGEVLPNPVQIQPGLLDMTVSSIVQGRCEDHFTITNSNKRFPVKIKIKLTSKMKQLISITPMETFIPTGTRVSFLVGFCSKDLHKNVREDFVHLTIKIIIIGDKSVYRNVPPIYYEILAPCSSEFLKLYRKASL
ncbi:uncharacterized protein LOC133527508 [Cydia pomonella]|uniref:uncharacterized protein LOC133527508 n=1 Tax=Cydia pomonella TaxID=82600 RepID=UPI002ADDF7B4|nr:uncharacterized protein LOC133527508 [Cydia pomonella]